MNMKSTFKPTNNMTTFHTKGQLHPNNTHKSKVYATIALHEAAAKYAGLSMGFDREKESYYNHQKLDIYDAYIAGYVAALTTPVTNIGETNQFDEMEAYLEEQL